MVFLTTCMLAIKETQEVSTLENGCLVILLTKLGNKEGKRVHWEKEVGKR